MNESSQQAGTLYVVATPIGNLDDISLRAITTLQQCDWVVCEDTRHSQRLFQAHGISTKTKSLHQHNENQEAAKIIQMLQAGQDVALVSDAGTPLISDPGFPLLQQAHEQNIKVVPIPGASALITLLSVAAINTASFTFHGFLPAKSQQKKRALEDWLPLHDTHVFYESSHRILDTLAQLEAVFGPTTAVAMGRELTKRFEQIYRGEVGQLHAQVAENPKQQKGEFVLAIQGDKKQNDTELTTEQAQLANSLKALLPPKVAAKTVADHYGINKKKVYQFILDEQANA